MGVRFLGQRDGADLTQILLTFTQRVSGSNPDGLTRFLTFSAISGSVGKARLAVTTASILASSNRQYKRQGAQTYSRPSTPKIAPLRCPPKALNEALCGHRSVINA